MAGRLLIRLRSYHHHLDTNVLFKKCNFMFYHAGNYCNDLVYIYVIVNIDSNILSRYTCLCLCFCSRRALRLLLLLLLSKGLTPCFIKI